MVQFKKDNKLNRSIFEESIGFGPVIEEGLIIGFSILALLVIISIILSILDWSQGLVDDLLNDFGG